MWLKSDIPYISSSISSIEDLCNMKLCLNSERLKKGPLTLMNDKIILDVVERGTWALHMLKYVPSLLFQNTSLLF
ncbi:uncharacterized protein [Zea mays]|uniref:Uncharacterized protein n=1 Tax=Zea mays TaxID=4577 RepID=C4J2I1_MAIZE|nr:uncharacterized protein LOC103653486 [Zea mays]ACR35381.1 unknown [Zea mays]|eukprot:XP_008678598.1 uncharacterized protein LOC103653486 [Zea mays]